VPGGDDDGEMRASVPNPFFAAVGLDVPYRDAVECGDFVFVSGQTSIDHDTLEPLHPDDVVAQADEAIDRVQAILDHFGRSLDDVVKLDAYFVSPAKGAGEALAAIARRLGARAAVTAVEVSGLVRGGLLVEVDAIAVDGTAAPLIFTPGCAAPDLDAALGALAEALGADAIGMDRLARVRVSCTSADAAAAAETRLRELAPHAVVTSLVVPGVIAPGASIALDGVGVTAGAITPMEGAPGDPRAVILERSPLAFVAASRAAPAGDALPEQMAGVMDGLRAAVVRCGAVMDDVVKQCLYYASWDGWSESVQVRGRYVDQPLAAIAVGAGASAPQVLVQSDAVVFIDAGARS
jgi:enamine deaminase RidA (YjgF/YER057c/UK114 family)